MIADKIEYIIMLIKLFARRFGLSYMQAFRYVCRHDGIEFAERHYNILHTLTFEDQVEALAAYCHRIRRAVGMKLFHGSNMKVEVIDLAESRPAKDFARATYLSAEEQQAKEMAQFKVVAFGGDVVPPKLSTNRSVMTM